LKQLFHPNPTDFWRFRFPWNSVVSISDFDQSFRWVFWRANATSVSGFIKTVRFPAARGSKLKAMTGCFLQPALVYFDFGRINVRAGSHIKIRG
jgi:hypothetical protein